MTVSLFAVFGLVAFNVFIVQSQFQLEKLQQQLDQERSQFEQLRLQSAELSSPQRILDIARRDLGMVDPSSVTHLTAPTAGAQAPTAGEPARAWAELKPFLAAEP